MSVDCRDCHPELHDLCHCTRRCGVHGLDARMTWAERQARNNPDLYLNTITADNQEAFLMKTIETVETYITFGVQYKEHPTHPDEDHPLGMFGNGYAVIEAQNRDIARDIAFAIFGRNWAFDYAERPRPDLYPAGEILRIPMIDRTALLTARAVIESTYKMAEGDSNDDEIEALLEARDLLEQLVGVIA